MNQTLEGKSFTCPIYITIQILEVEYYMIERKQNRGERHETDAYIIIFLHSVEKLTVESTRVSFVHGFDHCQQSLDLNFLTHRENEGR